MVLFVVGSLAPHILLCATACRVSSAYHTVVCKVTLVYFPARCPSNLKLLPCYDPHACIHLP